MLQKSKGITNADNQTIIPKENKLFDNYPNPFNPATKIKYSLKETSKVKVTIYDVIGEEVAVLVNEEKPAGFYTIDFNAGNLSSGIYFYSISSKDFYRVKKMILLK